MLHSGNEIPEPSPEFSPLGPLMIVRRVRDETPDARTFELAVPAEQRQAYKGRAGQFLRITIPGDAPSLSRSYSLSSAPELDEPLCFTVKQVAGGAVSTRLMALAEGALLHAGLPSGNFTLKPSTLPLLLIAGGSGITPIFSLLKTALRTSDRKISLLYANRDRASSIFHDSIAELERTFPARFSVRHHHSDAESFLTDDDLHAFAAPYESGQIYVCGPTPLMDLAEQAFSSEPDSRYELFFEQFLSPAVSVSSEPVRQVASAPLARVVIHIDGAEHDYTWQGKGTLLDAALDAGIPMPFSCREGHCGACKARLSAGTVEQSLALALSKRDRQRGNILACCAVPTSEHVVLEYE